MDTVEHDTRCRLTGRFDDSFFGILQLFLIGIRTGLVEMQRGNSVFHKHGWRGIDCGGVCWPARLDDVCNSGGEQSQIDEMLAADLIRS